MECEILFELYLVFKLKTGYRRNFFSQNYDSMSGCIGAGALRKKKVVDYVNSGIFSLSVIQTSFTSV